MLFNTSVILAQAVPPQTSYLGWMVIALSTASFLLVLISAGLIFLGAYRLVSKRRPGSTLTSYLILLPLPVIISFCGSIANQLRRFNAKQFSIPFFSLTLLFHFLASASCNAEQFVLFDVTFDYTKVDADNSKPSKSHYYVKDKMLNADRPKDWTSPVDYRNGTVHVRLEVMDKPAGDEPTTWSICYIPNKGQKNGYGCLGTDIYKKLGVYEKEISMKSFWENDSIVWTEGIKQMDLVIKDNSGGSGHAHKRSDSEKFFPTKVRLTLTQISAGSKYDPKLSMKK